MTTPVNPFDRFEELFERMGRQFEEAARAWETDEYGSPMPGFEAMSVDLVEREGEYVATVDLPGFERDEIDVRVTDGALHVEATHEKTEEEREGTYLRKERRHRSMERSIRLPEPVEAEETEATFENGVLTVTVPRSEAAKASKKIEIAGE